MSTFHCLFTACPLVIHPTLLTRRWIHMRAVATLIKHLLRSSIMIAHWGLIRTFNMHAQA
jgi:hypothetical protein